MGYKTKVQRIRRARSEQWYVPLPTQLAAAMEFERSEAVEWLVEDKTTLALRRTEAPGPVLRGPADDGPA